MPTTAMTATPPRLRAAHVRRPHGVRGELRVEPLGGDPARFQPGLRLWSDAEPAAEFTVVAARSTGDGDVLLSLREVTSRDAADALRDRYLCVDSEARRELAGEEWFVWELVGLRVVDTEGGAVGVVDDVEHYAEQDVLVVRRAGAAELRIPMVRAHVVAVDVSSGIIVVSPWSEDEA